MWNTLSQSGTKLASTGLALVCLFAGVGCDGGWVSHESVRGNELQRLFIQGEKVPVTAPQSWPIRFNPIEIEKRYTNESGTQYRPILAWEPQESATRNESSFATMAREALPTFDAEKDEIDRLIVRIDYLDTRGNVMSSEQVELFPSEYVSQRVLDEFGTPTTPSKVRVSLVGIDLRGQSNN